MLAIVEAEISTSRSAPRCSRSGDSGALVSENGMGAASLMSPPAWAISPGTMASPAGRTSVWVVHGPGRDREPAPLGELLEVGVAAGAAAEAGRAHPAERRQRLVLRGGVVDVHHPGPQPAGDPHPPGQVGGEYRVDQAIGGVVGDLHGT